MAKRDKLEWSIDCILGTLVLASAVFIAYKITFFFFKITCECVKL